MHSYVPREHLIFSRQWTANKASYWTDAKEAGCSHQPSLNLLLMTLDAHGEFRWWLVCTAGHLGICPIGGLVCGSLPREDWMLSFMCAGFSERKQERHSTLDTRHEDGSGRNRTRLENGSWPKAQRSLPRKFPNSPSWKDISKLFCDQETLLCLSPQVLSWALKWFCSSNEVWQLTLTANKCMEDDIVSNLLEIQTNICVLIIWILFCHSRLFPIIESPTFSPINHYVFLWLPFPTYFFLVHTRKYIIQGGEGEKYD